MSNWVKVVNTRDLEEGECAIADIDGVQIAVFNIKGNYFAVEDHCTHDGIEFCANAVVENESIVCPWHGARFSVATGDVEAPPAYEALTIFPLQVTSEGDIEVKDDRWD